MLQQKEISAEPTSSQEEISLKDLIFTVRGWWRYLLRKWFIVLLAGILGGGIGLAYALLKKPTYVGELTFVLEENKSSSLGAYASIASQFGVDLGGSGGVGVFSGDNIMGFLKSRLMVEKTLLTGTNVDGKKQSLANLYISTYHLREGWRKDPRLEKIDFPITTERKSFTRLQDSILYTLYKVIAEKNLEVAKPDKKLSFIGVALSTENETFSKEFVETLVREAVAFYVNTKTQRSKQNVGILQAKADSIEILLNRKTYSAAASQDLNMNPARNLATVSTEVASRDKIMLQTVYGEVIKNLELAKLTMAQETPIIQIVDSPIYPLRKEKLGKLKGLVLGGLIAGILASIALIVRKIFADIMTQ